MQERQNPWTHFMRNNRPGGQALLADFHSAHGTTEDYGPIPAALIDSSDPAQLEAFVENDGGLVQPNEFLTSKIEGEVTASSPNQPVDNSVPGVSATWMGLYANYVAGLLGVATPYHDVKISDPTQLPTYVKGYSDFMAGTIPASQLPDLRMTILDTPDTGFHPKAGLTGAQIITQVCTQCHNSKLDQTVSRAKFNANLSLMSRAEKDIAINRVQRQDYDPRIMPPQRAVTLSPAEIQAVVQELMQ
jgi:hypothetical protein